MSRKKALADLFPEVGETPYDMCSYRAHIARHLRNRPSGFPTPNLAAPQNSPSKRDRPGLPAIIGMTPHAELEGSVDQITASSDILGPLKSASLY